MITDILTPQFFHYRFTCAWCHNRRHSNICYWCFCHPPLGFEPNPTIRFVEWKCLPFASSCDNVLNFPRTLLNYNNFKEKMTFALCGSHGFGSVWVTTYQVFFFWATVLFLYFLDVHLLGFFCCHTFGHQITTINNRDWVELYWARGGRTRLTFAKSNTWGRR